MIKENENFSILQNVFVAGCSGGAVAQSTQNLGDDLSGKISKLFNACGWLDRG
jgi:hypothetical protein